MQCNLPSPVIPVPKGFPAERTQLAPLQRQQLTRGGHSRKAAVDVAGMGIGIYKSMTMLSFPSLRN
jgi:hypothetical protein